VARARNMAALCVSMECTREISDNHASRMCPSVLCTEAPASDYVRFHKRFIRSQSIQPFRTELDQSPCAQNIGPNCQFRILQAPNFDVPFITVEFLAPVTRPVPFILGPSELWTTPKDPSKTLKRQSLVQHRQIRAHIQDRSDLRTAVNIQQPLHTPRRLTLSHPIWSLNIPK
jgi:hypothetical protein